MTRLLSGSAPTCIAYDDRSLSLAQTVGNAYRSVTVELTDGRKPQDALRAATDLLGRKLGDVVMMVSPSRSVLIDVPVEGAMSARDAEDHASLEIPKDAFRADADLVVSTRVQGKRAGSRRVSVGAVERDALTPMSATIEELGGTVRHAYHPAEAMLAALPGIDAAVWLSASYVMFAAVTKDFMLVKTTPRNLRTQGWIQEVNALVGRARTACGADFARRLAIIGAVDVADLELLEKTVRTDVLRPESAQQDQDASQALWWIEHGLDQCAAGKGVRQPVDLARQLQTENEAPTLWGAIIGAGLGVVATIVVAMLFAGMVAGESQHLANDKAALTQAQIAEQAKEGHVRSDIQSLGNAASQIAINRQSGSDIATQVERLGNIAIRNNIWMNGALTVSSTAQPGLDIAARTETALGNYQQALSRANYVGTWTRSDPHPTANGPYLTSMIGNPAGGTGSH